MMNAVNLALSFGRADDGMRPQSAANCQYDVLATELHLAQKTFLYTTPSCSSTTGRPVRRSELSIVSHKGSTLSPGHSVFIITP